MRFPCQRRSLVGEQKDLGRELHEQLSTDEQAAQAHSFDIHDTASSGEQKDGEQKDVGREGEFDNLKLPEQFSADEQSAQGTVPRYPTQRHRESKGMSEEKVSLTSQTYLSNSLLRSNLDGRTASI